MDKILVGVQLPPDSSGKITGAFKTTVYDETGTPQTVYVPATLIADSNGYEIGGKLLQMLEEINESLKKIVDFQEITTNVLGGR